ncbi:MAG: AbrB/MazE/SpoVT family DNA-binding domain-containing protein [Ruminococcaceae bacterium]|nr:AbrB/MazE/SpoVT family DNA-binding domain-containing protein [Oscillospiraceae bacterium]
MGIKGNIRAIDELGRIVVPIDFRSELEIKSGDLLKMELQGNTIVIRKNTPACVFCGAEDDLVTFGSKTVCKKCIDKISKI